MKRKVKGYAKQLRELKSWLAYWQMNRRMYRRWVRDADEKCKEIVQKICELRDENGQKTITPGFHSDGIQVQERASRVSKLHSQGSGIGGSRSKRKNNKKLQPPE